MRYEVFDRTGQRKMYAEDGTRYSPEIELQMLEAGYTIKIGGRRVTRKDVSARNEKNGGKK